MADTEACVQIASTGKYDAEAHNARISENTKKVQADLVLPSLAYSTTENTFRLELTEAGTSDFPETDEALDPLDSITDDTNTVTSPQSVGPAIDPDSNEALVGGSATEYIGDFSDPDGYDNGQLQSRNPEHIGEALDVD